MRKYGTTGAVFFLLLVLLVFVFSLTAQNTQPKQMKYSDVVVMLEDAAKHPDHKLDKISKIEVIAGDPSIKVFPAGSNERPIAVVVPPQCLNDFMKQANEAGIPIDTHDRIRRQASGSAC